MALSHDVVSQFAKMVNKPEEKKEETIKGTFQLINGKEYVKLDGSNIYTPVTSTVEAENGDRVNVLLKDHAALLTSNITSPSARNKDVTALRDEVDEQGNVIRQMDNSITQQGNSIIQMNNIINQQNDVLNSYGNVIDQQNNIIQQHGNVIEQHGDDITSMNNTIVSQGNSITQLNNTVDAQNNTLTLHDNRITANSNDIVAQGNTIRAHGTTLETFNSNIRILNSAFIIHDGVMEGLAQIIVNDLKTNHLNTTYATIDFSNIQMAAVTKLFTDSGIIKDLVVQQGKITGELVGVTIKGDLIEANTLKADKLVILGEDGLYYKLNIDGLDNISTDQASKFTLTASQPANWSTNYEDYYIISNGNYVHVTGQTAPTWTANTYYKLNSTHESGLDGTNILAHSITADRIQVTDLVAFGATIGGYHIDTHSLYSGAKSSINNSTSGVYLGDDGQMNIGNNTEYVKFYKDSNNNYKLDISAENIKLGSSNKTIQEEMVTVFDQEINDVEIGGRNYYIIKDSVEGYIDSNGTIASPSVVHKERTSDYIEVTPGENIYFQMWVTPEPASNDNYLWMAYQFYGSNKSVVGERHTKTKGANTGTLQFDFFKMVVPENAAYLRVSGRFYNDGRIKVEKGTLPTDWSPAPEDTDVNIEIGGRNYISNLVANWVNGSWSTPETGHPSVIQTAAGRISLANQIKVEPNELYWVKIYTKETENDLSNVSILFRHIDENGNYLGQSTLGIKDQKWKCPASCEYVAVTLYENCSLDYIENGTIQLKLEKGDTSTDWTYSAEDINTMINGVNITATSASDKLNDFLDGEQTTLTKIRTDVSTEIDNEIKKQILDKFTTLVGEEQLVKDGKTAYDNVQLINSVIRRGADEYGNPYIELGVEPTGDIQETYRLRMTNNEIYMVYGAGDSTKLEKLTKWYTKDGQSALEVNSLLTQQEMAIKPFSYIKNDDGSLSFRKVG